MSIPANQQLKINEIFKYFVRTLSASVLIFSASGAMAKDYSVLGTEISFSGFATAGFAISDKNFRYQRFINNDGTFKRDSILGGQVDIKLNDAWSITAQAKIAPSTSNDRGVTSKLTWAFLSWRPANDWLFRGGRLRIPLYLNSQNTDIGETYDFARLPTEVYSTAPTTDINGLSVSKTWNLFNSEVVLDGYVGTTNTHSRLGNYDYPPLTGTSIFIPLEINLYGAALTFQHEEHSIRFGIHDTYSHRTDGGKFIVTFPFVPITSKAGFFQVDDNALPGPGIPVINQLHSTLYTVGTDLALGNGFRFMGEYVRRAMRDIVIGPDSQAGYIALLKTFGNWTPYVSMSHLQSTDRTLDLFNRLNNNRLPKIVPNSALINASQRAAAARISAYDQTTWALGTSYQIDAYSKLKAEWALTKTGTASSFIDLPVNADSSDQMINVFSLSYSVVF